MPLRRFETSNADEQFPFYKIRESNLESPEAKSINFAFYKAIDFTLLMHNRCIINIQRCKKGILSLKGRKDLIYYNMQRYKEYSNTLEIFDAWNQSFFIYRFYLLREVNENKKLRRNPQSVYKRQRKYNTFSISKCSMTMYICSLETNSLLAIRTRGTTSRIRKSYWLRVSAYRDLLFRRANGFPLKWPVSNFPVAAGLGVGGIIYRTKRMSRPRTPSANFKSQLERSKEDRYEFLRDTRTSISVSKRDRAVSPSAKRMPTKRKEEEATGFSLDIWEIFKPYADRLKINRQRNYGISLLRSVYTKRRQDSTTRWTHESI